MKRGAVRFTYLFLMTGGLSLSSLFLFSIACADTVVMKDGSEQKGLVVERHADRIILSTEKGEVPVLLSDTQDIRYDDPEQNFMQIGRAYEAENKFGEALAYYEKASEVNPNFEEARKAASAMKSRFWAAATEGPKSEMEKQQLIYDSWGQGVKPESLEKKSILKDAKTLTQNLGLVLRKEGDWVAAEEVHSKKDAAAGGMQRGDRFVSIDGESLRYLSPEVVAKKMVTPLYSSFVLEYERDCPIAPASPGKMNLGLKLKLESNGIVVEKVIEGSLASDAGIKEGDLLSKVEGQSTRYMPINKVADALADRKDKEIVISVRRSVMLMRR